MNKYFKWPYCGRALMAAVIALSPLTMVAASQGSTQEIQFEKNQQWKLPYSPVDFVQSVDGKVIYVLTDNHKLLIYEPDGTLKASVDVDPGVVAIDTDARGENILLIDKEHQTFTSFAIDFVADIDISGAPFKGKINAPVTVTVFSDFE